MRTFISILVGLAAFVGAFIGMNTLISLITSGMENQDLRTILKVVCWISGFGITVYIGVLVGILAGSITDILLKHKPLRSRIHGKRRNH